MKQVNKVISLKCLLGEGCVWDAVRNNLLFVDIEGKRVYAYNVKTLHMKSFEMNDMVGCLALHKDGGIVVAVKDTLVLINIDTGVQTELFKNSMPEFTRYNDGKCDKHGALWIGTMAINQSHPMAYEAGSLFCIKENKIISRYEGFTISNGMAWNSDGNVFYHIDTPTRKIDAYDVKGVGMLEHKRSIIKTDQYEGVPDGMCIDEDGNLWVAMWGGGKVICFDPSSGMKIDEINLPVKNVSCCTFGGTDLHTLYITTAQDKTGTGGDLYSVKLQTKGVLPNKYRGK